MSNNCYLDEIKPTIEEETKRLIEVSVVSEVSNKLNFIKTLDKFRGISKVGTHSTLLEFEKKERKYFNRYEEQWTKRKEEMLSKFDLLKETMDKLYEDNVVSDWLKKYSLEDFDYEMDELETNLKNSIEIEYERSGVGRLDLEVEFIQPTQEIKTKSMVTMYKFVITKNKGKRESVNVEILDIQY